MTRSALFLPLVAAALAACAGEDETVTSLDVRVDFAEENMDPDSEGTQMCVNANGHVFIIWMDNRLNLQSDKRTIWFNRSLSFGNDGTWLPSPVKINLGDPNKPGRGQVWNPKLACNDLGVYVVWEDDRDGFLSNHQIYGQASLDGGDTWLPEDVQIDSMDPGGGSMSLLPQIEAVGTNIHVVWYDGFNGPYDIYHAKSTDGGTTYDSPQSLDITRGFAFSSNPQVEVSDNLEFVWVAWEESRDGGSDIYVNRSTNGGVTFGGAQRIDRGDENGQTNSFAPRLCSDGGQFIYAVWHDERSSTANRDIYFNFSNDGGANWQALARRVDAGDADGFSTSLFPSCSTEGAVAHVAWQDYRTDRAFDIWYREIENGNVGSDDDELRVDLGEEDFANAEGFANSVDAQIAVNDSGQVAIVWTDFRAEASNDMDRGFGDLRYNFKEPNSPFQEFDLRVDSWDAGGSFKTDVNVDLFGGDLYAAWTDGRNGTFDIYFTRIPLGGEGEAPVREAQ